MKKYFRDDHYLTGAVTGLLLAIAALGIVSAVLHIIGPENRFTGNPRVPFLLAFVPNLLLMRYYFVSLKIEKAAKGLLVVTFAGFLLVFLLL